MGSQCTTDCVEYIGSEGNQTATIFPDEYLNCTNPVPDPKPLGIEILRTNGIPTSSDITYKVLFKYIIISATYIFRFDVVVENALIDAQRSAKLINQSSGITITPNPDNISPFNQHLLQYNVKLGGEIIATIGESSEQVIFPSEAYIPEDLYGVYLSSASCDTFNYAGFVFFRKPKGNISQMLPNSSSIITNISLPYFKCNNICKSLPNNNIGESIPIINIEAQTKLNGSDIGDAVFTILDEFEYYNLNKITKNNTCKDRHSLQPKETIFRHCNVQIVSVVKGKGVTLWNKLNYLFDKGLVNLHNVYVFYKNIALYAMAKYILSRLLFNKFNINFLLGKYNDKFLTKLGNSRFCAFLEFFEQNDYNKYFLYSN